MAFTVAVVVVVAVVAVRSGCWVAFASRGT